MSFVPFHSSKGTSKRCRQFNIFSLYEPHSSCCLPSTHQTHNITFWVRSSATFRLERTYSKIYKRAIQHYFLSLLTAPKYEKNKRLDNGAKINMEHFRVFFPISLKEGIGDDSNIMAIIFREF